MKKSNLYPPIRPYRKGYLDVGDGHTLYYELCGNPKGRPVLYLHGGPGAGISSKDRQYFNPKKFNVILFDQRGAGKSKPFASMNNNTTWKLVEDINKLLKHTGIRKVFLFGGSWGSTLALVYAIKHPEKVTGMLLRGVFLSTTEEYKEFFGGYSAKMFPDAWERFLSFVPNRKNPVAYYIKQMNSKNKKISDKYAREWSTYEITMLKLVVPQKTLKKYLNRHTYRALGPLEAHYLSRNCFLPENYILKNCHKMKKIPTVIVHGRYDAICMPISAYKLHKALPRSKLYFVISGHGAHDKNMGGKLVEEMDKFGKWPKSREKAPGKSNLFRRNLKIPSSKTFFFSS